MAQTGPTYGFIQSDAGEKVFARALDCSLLCTYQGRLRFLGLSMAADQDTYETTIGKRSCVYVCECAFSSYSHGPCSVQTELHL